MLLRRCGLRLLGRILSLKMLIVMVVLWWMAGFSVIVWFVRLGCVVLAEGLRIVLFVLIMLARSLRVILLRT